MKKSKIITLTAFFASAIAILSSCSIKQVQYSKRTVSVSGTGTVEVEADNATIVLSVVTTAKEATLAAENNAKKMTAVTEAITALAVPKENISTQNYSIYQEQSSSGGKIIYGDYRVSNEIKIFLKDKNLASSVIDASIKAGANRLSSLNFGITDADLYVKQARTLAVQQAFESATLIAGTSGAMLGNALQINEEYSSRAFPKVAVRNAYAETMDASYSTPISGGKSSISVTVNAVYELK